MVEDNQYRERLLKVEEVARICGCSVSTVWRRVKDGTLPVPVKIGGTTRWWRAEILEFIQERLAARNGSPGLGGSFKGVLASTTIDPPKDHNMHK